MKKIYTILVCIWLLAGFVACEKDKDFALTTLTVQNETITPSYGSATIDCSFKSDATISEAFVQYSLSSSFAKYDVAKMTEEKGKYAAQLMGLADNTTYYIRYAVSNKYSSVVTEEVIEFQTLQCTVPTIVLDSITDVWENRAKAYIHLAFDGGASVTDMGVCWGTQANPTIEDIHKSTKDTVAVLDIPSLQPNTQYYVRAYAVNKVGVAYSEEKTFTTSKEIALPTVTTAIVTQITETNAVAGGNVTSDGGASVTERGVVYSTNPNPVITNLNNTIRPCGSGTGVFTYTMTGLQANTTYYVRAYAVNSKGTAYGEEVSFTTSKQIVLPSVTTAAVTQITETAAVAGGNVTSDGGASVTERGVVYATTQNPTTNNTKVTSGIGTGSFTCNLTNLQPNTTYYVRAYAVNSKGTAYGTQVSFTTNKQIVLPTVTTAAVTQITETSAVAGGNVTSDGGASVTERGVVYSTNPNPVITNLNNTIRPCGSGTGAFTYTITGLQPSTKYYVRAYAVNSKGTAYGEEVSFTTKEEMVDNPPSNLVAMLFSVSAGKQVTFSQGNLQYTQSTNTWSFAENQYDYIGTDNVTSGSVSSDPTYGYSKSGTALADKIDLFCWSTSYANFGVSTSKDYKNYSGSFVDWGTNKIGNDAPNTWRTLTYDEWEYLLYNRPNASSLNGVAQVNGVNGLILLPDNWTCPAGVTFKSGFPSVYSVKAYGQYQTFSADQWSKLESAGAVFLPASGYRDGSTVYGVQGHGDYWSATERESYDAYCLYLYSDRAGMRNSSRYLGHGVRLVKDLQ